MGAGSPPNVDIWIIDIARNVPLAPDLRARTGRVASVVAGRRAGRLRERAIGAGVDTSQPGQRGGRRRAGARELDAARESHASGVAQRLVRGWPVHRVYATHVVHHLRSSGCCPCSAIASRFRCVQTEFLETSGVFSPDGRWIAYTTDEAGQPNVYVQPFPGAGGKYQVSRDGGSHPLWRADGKELFYLGPDATLMAVPIDTTGRVRHRAAAGPLSHRRCRDSTPAACTPVAKDGQRFLRQLPGPSGPAASR